MAHFAKIDSNNVVVEVVVIPNDQEHRGQEFLNNDLKLDGIWLQTSYNTRAGIHVAGGTPLRKNFAGVGFSYDPELDAFIPQQPYQSWILDEEAGTWNAPIEVPDLDSRYQWDEASVSWIEVTPE